MADSFLLLSRRVPGLYAVLAFLTARRVVVRGPSMYPALRPGDRVLFDRLAYRLDDPSPGDIVLARHPARPGVRFIKRVAGVSGADGYELLGDNADASTDSRTLGRFRRQDIAGRGWLVYWPPERVRRLSKGS
jgi:nickel-type superoxide dismutase maturation protease